MLKISVVVPYHNESISIQRTLDSLASQLHPPQEIIVVNSSSTDNSFQLVNDWISKNKQRNPHIVFKNLNKGSNTPSSSKNVGIRAATSEWIALMDCGLIFNYDWLKKMSEFTLKNEALFSSGVGIFRGTGLIDKCAITHTYGYLRPRPTMPSSLIHKSVFEKCGLFLENRRAGYDADWPLGVKKAGIKRFINEQVTFAYDGINFGQSLQFIFKKLIKYSIPTVALPNYKTPYYYLVLFFMMLIILVANLKLAMILGFFYFLLRGYFIPLIKSRSIKILVEEPASIFLLPVVGLVMDCGRLIGYLLGAVYYHLNFKFKLPV